MLWFNRYSGKVNSSLINVLCCLFDYVNVVKQLGYLNRSIIIYLEWMIMIILVGIQRNTKYMWIKRLLEFGYNRKVKFKIKTISIEIALNSGICMRNSLVCYFYSAINSKVCKGSYGKKINRCSGCSVVASMPNFGYHIS